MPQSTIRHPALLGRMGAFQREAARLQASARSRGLFDLPADTEGVYGNVEPELEALRTLQMLGEAFGLPPRALADWHGLFARGKLPPLRGALVRGCREVLPDLMLRARTLMLYHDREGQGGAMQRVWRRGKQLQALVDLRARLLRDLDDPFRVFEDGANARVEVLRVVDVLVDRVARSLHLRFKPLPPDADGRPDYLLCSEGDLDVPGWLQRWVLLRLRQHGVPELNAEDVRAWLEADAAVCRGLQRCNEHLLAHAAFPPEAVRLAQQAYGEAGQRRVHVATIGWAWRYPALYRDVLGNAPQFCQLLPAVHLEWGELFQADSLRELRQWYRDQGMTAAGWRWLANTAVWPITAAESLLGRPAPDIVRLANCVAAAGPSFDPCSAFQRGLVRIMGHAERRRMDLGRMPWLLRAAWDRCVRQGDDAEAIERFLDAPFVQVAAWADRTGWAPDVHQRRAGWRSFEQAAARGAVGSRQPFTVWPVPLQPVQHGDLHAVALGNSVDLFVEGAVMQHCINNYAGAAAQGRFLAFAVRCGTARVATFSLKRERAGGAWAFHDCKGQFNSQPDHPDLWDLIEKALELTNLQVP